MIAGKPNVIHPRKNNYEKTVDAKNVVSINGMYKAPSNLGNFEKGKLHWQLLGANKIDYELLLGAKLSYIMYFNAKQLRHCEIFLYKTNVN